MNLYKIFLLSILTFCFSAIHAQFYDLQLIPVKHDMINGGDFQVKIQIKKASGVDFQLGNTNIRFSYNAAALSLAATPILTQHNFDNNISAAYSDMTSLGSGSGYVSVNVDLLTANTGTPSVTTSWEDVATIAFTITDNSQSSQMVFQTTAPGYVVAFEDDQTTRLQTGTFSGLDQPLNGVLPVEWLAFEAEAQANQVVLSWATVSEANNSHFEIQHSQNTPEWKTIGKMSGKGTAQEVSEYRFVHSGLPVGTHYYRLRQVDFDGNYSDSEIRSVEITASASQVILYPNPAKDQISLNLTGLPGKHESFKVEMMDMAGKRVFFHESTSRPGNLIEIRLPSELPNGWYMVRIQSPGYFENHKLQLQR